MLWTKSLQSTQIPPVCLFFVNGCCCRRHRHHRRISEFFKPFVKRMKDLLKSDSIAALVKPRCDICKNDFNVLIGFSRCQTMPHSWIQLYGLVLAASFLVQGLAYFRVCYYICFPMQHKEGECHLPKAQPN